VSFIGFLELNPGFLADRWLY